MGVVAAADVELLQAGWRRRVLVPLPEEAVRDYSLLDEMRRVRACCGAALLGVRRSPIWPRLSWLIAMAALFSKISRDSTLTLRCHESASLRLADCVEADRSAVPATSAPGLGSPLPHLRRDWGSPPPHLRRDWASSCAKRATGVSQACHSRACSPCACACAHAPECA